MARRMLLAAVAPMMALTSCATTSGDPYARRAVDDFELRPYATHEECRRLETGERLDYAFVSTEPLAFDLRYREGDAVLMPIVRPQAREESGLYAAPFAKSYCLAWEAGGAGARLSYRLQVHPAGP